MATARHFTPDVLGDRALPTPPRLSEQLDGKTVEWMEKVSDAEFNAPLPGQAAPAAASGPSRAQQLVGDVAPKLAELTDNVLFADV